MVQVVQHWPPSALVHVWKNMCRSIIHAQTTVSVTEVSLLPVIVCGTPCRHICETGTGLSTDVSSNHWKDTFSLYRWPRHIVTVVFMCLRSSLTCLLTFLHTYLYLDLRVTWICAHDWTLKWNDLKLPNFFTWLKNLVTWNHDFVDGCPIFTAGFTVCLSSQTLWSFAVNSCHLRTAPDLCHLLSMLIKSAIQSCKLLFQQDQSQFKLHSLLSLCIYVSIN